MFWDKERVTSQTQRKQGGQNVDEVKSVWKNVDLKLGVNLSYKS